LLRRGDNDSYWLTSALVLEFGLGCAVAWMIGRGMRGGAAMAGAAGFAVFATMTYIGSNAAALHSLPRFLIFGTSGAALLYSLVALEIEGRLVLPTVIQRLGDVSYSMYLWHWIILWAALAVVTVRADPWSRNLGAASYVAISIALSFVTYRLVEVPAIRWVDNLLAARGPWRQAAWRL
jgi:exopolysaccharide production protein ExoZ